MSLREAEDSLRIEAKRDRLRFWKKKKHKETDWE